MEEAATQTLGCAFLLIGLVSPPLAAAFLVFFGWNKRWWLALLSGFVFLVASQVSAMPFLMGIENPFPSYHYETADGGFRAYECTKSSACTWRELLLNLADYRRSQGDASIEMYRTFQMQPWRFWRWWEYSTGPRWQLRYQPARYCADLLEDGCISGPPEHRRSPTKTPGERARQTEELVAWVPEFSVDRGAE